MARNRNFGTEIALPENPAPHLACLPPLQQKFVLALVMSADPSNETQAATLAGYKNPTVAACQNMRSKAVITAIRTEADLRVRAGALIGAKALIEIAMDSRHKQRFQAAQALLDRSGLQVVTEHHVVVEDTRSNDELKQFIVAVAKRNGLDPRTLLGQDVVEGDFAVIEDDPFALAPGEFVAADHPEDHRESAEPAHGLGDD